MMKNSEKTLLVDDEIGIRRLLRQHLAREGYQCLEAGGVAEAQVILRAGDIGLVILDVRMPGKTGLDFLPELKAGYPDTAVIMATAVDFELNRELAARMGAGGYLTKPFSSVELKKTIAPLLE